MIENIEIWGEYFGDNIKNFEKKKENNRNLFVLPFKLVNTRLSENL